MRDRWAELDRLVRLDQWAQLDRLVQKELLDHLVLLVDPALLAKQAQKDHQVLSDQLVL